MSNFFQDPSDCNVVHIPIEPFSLGNGYTSNLTECFLPLSFQQNVDYNDGSHYLNHGSVLTCNINGSLSYALTFQRNKVKTYLSYAYPHYQPLDFLFDADFAPYPLQPDNTLLDLLQSASQNEHMMPQQTYYSFGQYFAMLQEEYPILKKQSPSASSMEYRYTRTTNGTNTSVFTTPDERDNHSTLGNIPEIFPCTFPGCVKTFPKSHLLKSHQTCHSSERLFACPYTPCPSKFARKHDRTRHEKTHTDSKPHICRFCQYKFARSDTLRRHLKIKRKCLEKYREDSSRLNVHTTGQQ